LPIYCCVPGAGRRPSGRGARPSSNGHTIRVHRAAGNAYANVGLYEQAFQWRTRGLELALELADPDEGELLWRGRAALAIGG